MPFIEIPGLSGKVYVPECSSASKKKHPCRDCFGCQHCSHDRCSLCRGTDPSRGRYREETREYKILPR